MSSYATKKNILHHTNDIIKWINNVENELVDFRSSIVKKVNLFEENFNEFKETTENRFDSMENKMDKIIEFLSKWSKLMRLIFFINNNSRCHHIM